MMVPDRNGELADVLLGYDDAEGYLVNGPHFGSHRGPDRQPHRRRFLYFKTELPMSWEK